MMVLIRLAGHRLIRSVSSREINGHIIHEALSKRNLFHVCNFVYEVVACYVDSSQVLERIF